MWRYLNRLVQFVGPTPAMLEHPNSWAAKVQETRTGRRDDELKALNPARMSEQTRWLLRQLLVASQRYQLALGRFHNLRPLNDATRPGADIVIHEEPLGTVPVFNESGIVF